MRNISQLVLFASLFLASGLSGQGNETAVRLGFGADFTSRHDGPVVELQVVPRSSTQWSHGLGVGITAGVNTPGNVICVLVPGGTCVVYGSVFASAFYEPRLTLAPATARFTPYVGSRLSVVRGWGGLGGGIAGVGGFAVALPHNVEVSFSTIGGFLSTAAVNSRGEAWRAWHAGVRFGIATAF